MSDEKKLTLELSRAEFAVIMSAASIGALLSQGTGDGDADLLAAIMAAPVFDRALKRVGGTDAWNELMKRIHHASHEIWPDMQALANADHGLPGVKTVDSLIVNLNAN